MSDDDNRREMSRLWRVYKTSKQMCHDRGYEIDEDELDISLAEFQDKCGDASGAANKAKMSFSARPSELMTVKYTALPTKSRPEPQQATIGTIYVEFTTEPSVGIKHLRNFAQFLHDKNYYSGIYITPGAVTTSALKQAANLPIGIEVFPEQDLLVNITKHELVPKHILLSPEEKKALLERYRLKETQLPRIRVEDPVAKHLGLRRGQVVKIIRKSETAGRYASYRWAI